MAEQARQESKTLELHEITAVSQHLANEKYSFLQDLQPSQTIQSEHLPYRFRKPDPNAVNSKPTDRDQTEWSRLVSGYGAIGWLKTVLEDQFLAFRDCDKVNVDANIYWQQTIHDIVRKVDGLHFEMEDLGKHVEQEWLRRR